MINNLLSDISYLSINHDKEELCGDHVEISEFDGYNSIVVLADGLGSGVKANILSTLTSKMLSTMMSGNIPIEDCVKQVAETLPTCKERGIAYSTFTIAKIKNNKYLEIYNFDNPPCFMLREGKLFPLPYNEETIEQKRIIHSKVNLKEGDAIFLISDGVIHAGIGQSLNFGWSINDVIEFMEGLYSDYLSSKSLATILISHVNGLYAKHPGDDATCAVIKIKRRKQVNLIIGPASIKEDDERMMSLFFAKDGKHIVCGGTTSHLAADYLKEELEFPLDYLDKEIPPTARIQGVDLVTEGVITLNRVYEYSIDVLSSNDKYFDWSYKMDGASQIARALFEDATDINFFVGCAINPAHQKEGLPIKFSTKLQLIEALSENLKKMNKNIKVSYF